MNTFWAPERVSMLQVPYDTPAIKFADGFGEVCLEPVALGYTESVSPRTEHDRVALTYSIIKAIEHVTRGIERKLAEDDLVADPEHCDLSIRVEAYVKAWPAYPGVTVPDVEEDA